MDKAQTEFANVAGSFDFREKLAELRGSKEASLNEAANQRDKKSANENEESFNFRKEGGPDALTVLGRLTVLLNEKYRFGKVMSLDERAALCIESLRGMGLKGLQYNNLNESAIREKAFAYFDIRENEYLSALYSPKLDFEGALKRAGIMFESAPQKGDKRISSLKDYGKDDIEAQKKKNSVYLNKLNGVLKTAIDQNAELIGGSLIWSFYPKDYKIPLMTISFELSGGKLNHKALLNNSEISNESVAVTEWNTIDKMDELLKKIIESAKLKDEV